MHRTELRHTHAVDPARATTAPWSVDADEVARVLGSDPSTGFTSEEAARRLAQSGPNRLESAERLPWWQRLRSELGDPIAYLLLVALVLSLGAWTLEGAHGTPFEAIVIFVIIVANAGLRLVQQRKAEEAVAALQKMVSPTVVVVRDGREVAVPAEALVPGDILVVREGDVVGADGRLLEATSLMVAEAALTGESEPVLKGTEPLPEEVPLGDRHSMVYAGTAVVRGRGRAVVTATGMRTEMGRLAAMLDRTADERTPLQRQLDRLGKQLGVAAVAIAVVVVTTILATFDVGDAAQVAEILVLGVSLAVAAVPEGLPTVLTVVLALGVHRMARRGAIVKKLASVETLGSTSVICTDKTGTLTKNEMTIQRIATRSGETTVTGSGYRPEGELLVAGERLTDGPVRDEVDVVLCAGSLANDADLVREGDEWRVTGDPTDGAFLVAASKLGIRETCANRFELLAEVPFSSERKRVSAVMADRLHRDRRVIFTKGAPDVVLERSAYERVGNREEPLDDRRRAELRAAIDRLADSGLRTIAVAYRELDTTVGGELDASLEHDLVFAGVAGMIDPPRPEVPASIAQAQRAGVRVMMITGDHPRTAARIAADLGIVAADVRAEDAVLSGHDLDRLDDETFRRRLRSVSVYARVAPEHKLRIVVALRGDGHIVAMTGDGVNDAPALKAADIGVAMGVTGTDVAKQAADMILTDDNFATIVAAIREGRSIFANVRKFVRFLIGSNLGEVLTVFLGVLAASMIGLDLGDGTIVAPLLAAQILWVNLVADTAPALALGVDPPPRDVMDRPPRRPDDAIVDRRIRSAGILAGLVIAVAALLTIDLLLPQGWFEASGELPEAQTAAFTVVALGSLFNCLNSRSDRESVLRSPWSNPLLWAAIGVSVMLQVAVVHLPVLNRAFATVPLSAGEWALCVAMASAVLWVEELRKLLDRRPHSQR